MPKHKTKGPLSLQGATVPKHWFSSDICLPLRVINRDSAVSGRGLPAYVHPSSVEQLLLGSPHPGQIPSTLFLQLASGCDCILYTRVSNDIPVGCIQVDEVQQANLRLCANETYKFSVFEVTQQHKGNVVAGWQQAAAAVDGSDDEQEVDAEDSAAAFPFHLVDVDAEVRLLHSAVSRSTHSKCSTAIASCGGTDVIIDAQELTLALSKQCFGRVLAVNEYVVVELPHKPPLLLRITSTNTLTAEEQQEAIGYHCFRGLLTPDTKVYFTASSGAAVAAKQQQQQQQLPVAADDTQQQFSQLNIVDPVASSTINGHHSQPQLDTNGWNSAASRPVQSRVAGAASGLQLVNAATRAAAAPATNVVHIYTSDGEWFPVKKKLLRPCIALTKAVRDSTDTSPKVHVPIDTLTFDRVLIFLEAQALHRKPPGFAIHLLNDLQQASAGSLGMQPDYINTLWLAAVPGDAHMLYTK